jgi:predicted RNase H-like HicB family nuclease
MQFTIETEQESDGRWLAEVVEIPGVMQYGSTREDAVRQAEAFALRVMAERIESGEPLAMPIHISLLQHERLAKYESPGR